MATINKEIKELQQENTDLKNKVASIKKEIETATNRVTAEQLLESRKIQAQHDHEQGMLSLINKERARHNEETFDTYEEYLQYKNAENGTKLGDDITIVKHLPRKRVMDDKSLLQQVEVMKDQVVPLTTPMAQVEGGALVPKLADGSVYHIVSGGYYLCWNKSRCYIQKANDPVVNILVKASRLSGEDTTIHVVPSNVSVKDLTRSEVDDIVKGKPAYAELFKVYSKFANVHNVYFDTAKAVSIW